MSKRTFSNDDAEVLASHALNLCKAVREMLAGNVPKLVEEANDLRAYKTLRDLEQKVEGVEVFITHRRKYGASDEAGDETK